MAELVANLLQFSRAVSGSNFHGGYLAPELAKAVELIDTTCASA